MTSLQMLVIRWFVYLQQKKDCGGLASDPGSHFVMIAVGKRAKSYFLGAGTRTLDKKTAGGY